MVHIYMGLRMKAKGLASTMTNYCQDSYWIANQPLCMAQGDLLHSDHVMRYNFAFQLHGIANLALLLGSISWLLIENSITQESAKHIH